MQQNLEMMRNPAPSCQSNVGSSRHSTAHQPVTIEERALKGPAKACERA